MWISGCPLLMAGNSVCEEFHAYCIFVSLAITEPERFKGRYLLFSSVCSLRKHAHSLYRDF